MTALWPCETSIIVPGLAASWGSGGWTLSTDRDELWARTGCRAGSGRALGRLCIPRMWETGMNESRDAFMLAVSSPSCVWLLCFSSVQRAISPQGTDQLELSNCHLVFVSSYPQGWQAWVRAGKEQTGEVTDPCDTPSLIQPGFSELSGNLGDRWEWRLIKAALIWFRVSFI